MLIWTKILRRLLCCTTLTLPVHAESDSPSQDLILVVTPTTAGNTYWPEVHSVMDIVAADLDIGIEFLQFDVSDRFTAVTSTVRRLRKDPSPDAAIFTMGFSQLIPVIELAEDLEISFALNGPFSKEQLRTLGDAPGDRYTQWVRLFEEDEQAKGYLLGQELIRAATAAVPDPGVISIAGINGAQSWAGSIQREAGLRQAVDEHPNTRLLQMVYSDWTAQEGRRMARRLLRRYPDVSAIWTASDQLSIGAAQAISENADRPKQIVTGGLDLSPAGLNAISRGQLVATTAATELMWAQVVIDLHDLVRSETRPDDFEKYQLAVPVVATASNVKQVLEFQQRQKQIPFRDFSRHYNGGKTLRLNDLLEDL